VLHTCKHLTLQSVSGLRHITVVYVIAASHCFSLVELLQYTDSANSAAEWNSGEFLFLLSLYVIIYTEAFPPVCTIGATTLWRLGAQRVGKVQFQFLHVMHGHNYIHMQCLECKSGNHFKSVEWQTLSPVFRSRLQLKTLVWSFVTISRVEQKTATCKSWGTR